jgi:peptidoglycan-associated lipoprotein
MKFFFHLWVLSLACLCMAPSRAYAQKAVVSEEYTEIGDRYFDNEEYFVARDYYEKAVASNPQNSRALYQLAESLRNFYEYEQAEKAYQKYLTQDKSKAFPLAQFWYAITLKANGKYDQAKVAFEVFVKKNATAKANDDIYQARAQREIRGCEMALETHPADSVKQFRHVASPLSGKFIDYVSALFENDSSVVLTTSRDEIQHRKKDNRYGERYSDNIRYVIDSSGWKALDRKDNFEALNTARNDGAGVFNAKKARFYYTNCSEGPCALYVSVLTGGQWQPPVKLNQNVNQKDTETKQPALNHQGDTLFFVSNRPGGEGMTDLWYSISKNGDDWGSAVNLGETINSPFQESSPYYSEKEKGVFFSSNGRVSWGGMDVYFFKNPSLAGILHLKPPFNSSRDDLYFLQGEQLGYLCSDRQGNFDVFTFGANHDLDKIATPDPTLIPVKPMLAIKPPEDSTLQAKNTTPEPKITEENTSVQKGNKSFDVLGKVKPMVNREASSVNVSGRLVDKDTKKPIPHQNVTLENERLKIMVTNKTDDKGKFAFKNMKPDKNYQLLVEKPGEASPSAKNKLTEVEVEESSAPVSRLLFENIYFDFDKSDLRDVSIQILDELAGIYQQYPEVQFEMKAGTDNLGTDAYNIALGQRRGTSALDYLVEHGVDRSALIVNVLGESNPMVENLNEQTRQLNRRVEFYVKGDKVPLPTYVTYVPDEATDVRQIAKKFGMKISEVVKANKLKNNRIAAYQPLYVKRAGQFSEEKEEYTADDIRDMPLNKTYSNKTGYLNQNTEQFFQHLPGGLYEVHTVSQSQTLTAIRLQYGMTEEELKYLNGLSNDQIHTGQTLKVLNKDQLAEPHIQGVHLVKAGETASSIAKMYGLSVRQLRLLNNLSDNYMNQGMLLRVR